MTEPGRKDKRQTANHRLLVRCDSWDEFAELYAEDISRGGMFIATDDPPPALTMIEVRLLLPEGHEVPLRARVVHVLGADSIPGRGPGVGVEFVQLDEPRKQQIKQLVEFARAQGASHAPASFATHMFGVATSLRPAELAQSLPPAPSRSGAPVSARPRSGRPTLSGNDAPGSSRSGKKRRRKTRTTVSGDSRPSKEPPEPKPSDPQKLKLGLSHIAHKRYALAFKVFSDMLEGNPGDVEAMKWIHVTRARDCLQKKDEEGAARAYQQALQHDESNLEARKFVREFQLKRRLTAIPFGRFFVKSK